jgi:uncharacterized membrane protein HdeD (DUF308 family)
MFDSLTAFSIASIFSLMSGALLGSVYRSLPEDVQPSARDWVIGTLMLAACLAFFAALGQNPASWIRLSGNVFWFFGIAFYWRAIRRHFKLHDNPMVFFAAGAATMASATFLLVLPHFSTRVALTTLLGCVPMIGAAYTLIKHRQDHNSVSGWVLVVLFLASTVLLIVRGLYFHNSATQIGSMVQSKNFALSLAPILLSALPILGTTAFLLLCFERGLRAPHLAARVDAPSAR